MTPVIVLEWRRVEWLSYLGGLGLTRIKKGKIIDAT